MSAFGPKRAFQHGYPMSAFGGKADMAIAPRNRLRPFNLAGRGWLLSRRAKGITTSADIVITATNRHASFMASTKAALSMSEDSAACLWGSSRAAARSSALIRSFSP